MFSMDTQTLTSKQALNYITHGGDAEMASDRNLMCAIMRDEHVVGDYISFLRNHIISPSGVAIIEEYLCGYPAAAVLYAREVLKGRFKRAEHAISTSASLSYNYARFILKGRFERGERAIATDSGCAYAYAADVIRGRWRLGEPIIATNPALAYEYAVRMLGDSPTPWPIGESCIARDPEHAYRYALNMFAGGWTAPRSSPDVVARAHASIAKSAKWSNYYAKNCLGKRFMEGEPVISGSTYWSELYTRAVCDGVRVLARYKK